MQTLLRLVAASILIQCAASWLPHLPAMDTAQAALAAKSRPSLHKFYNATVTNPSASRIRNSTARHFSITAMFVRKRGLSLVVASVPRPAMLF